MVWVKFIFIVIEFMENPKTRSSVVGSSLDFLTFRAKSSDVNNEVASHMLLTYSNFVKSC